MKTAHGAASDWLAGILGRLHDAEVAVFGDFCVDAYWQLMPDRQECSVETGLPVRSVFEQRYSLGGAGNVVMNLAAMKIRRVHAIGMVGDDLFGWQMRRMLDRIGADATGLYAAQRDWQTMVYAKPYEGDEEQNRLDFGSFNKLSAASVDALMVQLDQMADGCAMVILNQQVTNGLALPPVIERINQVIVRHSKTRFIVDARQHAERYRGAMLKLNAHEAGRLVGQAYDFSVPIPADEVRAFAQTLRERTGQPVFITRGENGIMLADDRGIHVVPGIQITGAVDPVGAGDTVVAAIAAAMAVDGDPLTAAKLANIAANITVRKLRMTGTASPEELRAVGPNPDYVYEPELAAEPRKARYAEGGEIEIVRPLLGRLRIEHAIFDHDGTISTLREGWERIMEPMMLRAVLGDRLKDADTKLYYKVRDAVRDYIDKTTGVQTLVQMVGLVEMVQRFGCVPKEKVLDAAGYKQVYNKALLAHVDRRMAKLSRGELRVEDFLVSNAWRLLDRLHACGVKLYLASGTDTADVLREAEAMGYAHLFEGRIYGAVGDVAVETKLRVMRQIIHENRLDGPGFVTFGDGPVEIRASHQCGGIAVGVASDEVRRFGLNPTKRARLIRAGADLIVPDFSQLDRLLQMLGL